MRRCAFMVMVFNVVVILIAGCGGKYTDAVKVNEEFIKISEEYITDLGKADNARSVAEAMNKFSDGFENLAPRMRKISEKYPGLKDKTSIPEEMKESQRKAEEVGRRFAGSFMKIMPYMKDPEVRSAQKRMNEVLKLMHMK